MANVPTPHQLKALALALPSGWLRRLPGGYWVGHETPWRSMTNGPPKEAWVGTQTVTACAARGWFEFDGNTLRRLTDAGRALSIPRP